MNLAPIRRCLDAQLDGVWTAALIYGSVASGRSRPDSDLDCFVLTNRELDPDERAGTETAFADLQRTLGYAPDADFPVEVFSAERCRLILAGPVLDGILEQAAAGRLLPAAESSDDVEVLRALLDHRIVIRSCEDLDDLTRRAEALMKRHQADHSPICSTLRLRRATVARG